MASAVTALWANPVNANEVWYTNYVHRRLIQDFGELLTWLSIGMAVDHPNQTLFFSVRAV